jgi:flavin reductase
MVAQEPSLVERQVFRDAMARLGAAVHVITSDGSAGRLGFTASAVCSVSDNPPTLLVSMNRGSLQNQSFRDNGAFCVNSLCAEQEALSGVFAGFGQLTMEERFAAAKWDRLVTGAPALRGAVVSFDCRIASTVEIATHTLLIGEVVSIRTGRDGESALMYYGRSYHALTEQSRRPTGSR